MAEDMKGDRSTWGLRIESDWITTFGALLLFTICGLLLARDIRHLVSGDLRPPAHFQITFLSIWNKLFEAIAAVYCFLFVRNVPNKSAKFASLLVGLCLAVAFLLSFIRFSSSAQHAVALGRSILWQIALVTCCVAIADWFRSVVIRPL